MNRSGSLLDIPVIIVVVFTLAIAVLFSHLILTKIAENTTQEQIDQETLQKGINALEVFDAGIIFVNGAMWLVSIIFAVRIRTSPVFFIPAIFMLVISAWLSAEVANIYHIITTVSPITGSANAFPTTLSLFENFPLVVGFLSVVLIVALYAKIRTAQGGGI